LSLGKGRTEGRVPHGLFLGKGRTEGRVPHGLFFPMRRLRGALGEVGVRSFVLGCLLLQGVGFPMLVGGRVRVGGGARFAVFEAMPPSQAKPCHVVPCHVVCCCGALAPCSLKGKPHGGGSPPCGRWGLFDSITYLDQSLSRTGWACQAKYAMLGAAKLVYVGASLPMGVLWGVLVAPISVRFSCSFGSR
jgi:hypothetical protein